jgi:hypothetical protein
LDYVAFTFLTFNKKGHVISNLSHFEIAAAAGDVIGENYVSIDPGGSGDILQSGETILESESLIDIGELIGRYTFGRKEKKNETVRLAHTRNRQIENWVD